MNTGAWAGRVPDSQAGGDIHNKDFHRPCGQQVPDGNHVIRSVAPARRKKARHGPGFKGRPAVHVDPWTAGVHQKLARSVR